MLDQTYLKWLGRELLAVKYSLLIALEERDRLLYIEEPGLKEEYIQKIGIYEEQVLKLELEISLQEKKKQMIQAAINRREEIDLEKIEELLNEERARQLERLNQTFKVERKADDKLTEEEKKELQSLYKEIVRDFHPQVHTNLTENQIGLYERALDTYKRQNLEELRLIYDMLYSDDLEGIELELSLSVSENEEEIDVQELAKSLMEDYSLAAKLYAYFEPLEEDGTFLSAKKRYEDKQKVLFTEIEDIYKRIPFIAKETLRSEGKLKEYLNSLSGRRSAAELRIEELQKEIAIMIGA